MTQQHAQVANAADGDCCDSLRSTNHKTIDKTTSTNDFDWDLTIVDYLKADIPPAKIAAKLGVPKQTLQYHLNKLVKQGVIYKAGYGTWNVLKEPTKENPTVRTSSYVTSVKTPQQVRKEVRTSTQSDLHQFQQDSVRAHAFVTTFQVPRNMRNWNSAQRTQYLTTHNIPYKSLGIRGGGQRIIVKGKKVWLLNPVIIIYDKASYFAEDALNAKGTALATHLSIIKHIERLLHVSFQIGSDHKFKVSRQHYALIQNALAKQYNEAGEKLEIRNGKGLWFLIDDSYSLNEAETVHPSSAMTDSMKVQSFFNGLKDIPASQGAPSYTPSFVLEMMHGIQQNQAAFAENMTSHIDAVKTLGEGVQDMTSILKQLKEDR